MVISALLCSDKDLNCFGFINSAQSYHGRETQRPLDSSSHAGYLTSSLAKHFLKLIHNSLADAVRTISDGSRCRFTRWRGWIDPWESSILQTCAIVLDFSSALFRKGNFCLLEELCLIPVSPCIEDPSSDAPLLLFTLRQLVGSFPEEGNYT